MTIDEIKKEVSVMDVWTGSGITADGEIYFAGEPRPAAHAGQEAPKRPKQTKKEQQDIIGINRFYKEIPDEEAAIAFVEERIWSDTPWCPRCGRDDTAYRVKNGKPMSHRCRACKMYFSVRTGTVMEKTNLPIRTWLLAIHLMHTSRKGISSVQLSKMLDVTQATAWFLGHRIRKAMEEDNLLMGEVVQVDETYIGGKERWKHADKKLHKRWPEGRITVFGIKEDGIGGKVMAFPMPYVNNEALQDEVMLNVNPGSTVYTDSHPAYRNLSYYGYEHATVNHGVGQYVNDKATTNGIESFWALLKRGYVGVFHYMSWKHLHRYVNEFAARHNAGQGNGFRTIGDVLRRSVGRRLTYKRLIGKR